MDILVVDPEAEIRLLFFVATEQLGCEVYFAESGAEALEALAQHPSIGEVLLALHLPDIDSCTLAERIRNADHSRHLPIVFLSDAEDSATLVRLFDYGDDVVIKPFSQEVLLAKLLAHRRTHELYARIAQNNRDLEIYRAHTETEHRIAGDVFARITAQNLTGVPGVATLVAPCSSFNGDLLLLAPRPGGELNVLVADITGHGLPAALGTLPLAEIFFAASAKGLGVDSIAREMNRSFCNRMPDYLLCAAALIAVRDGGRRLQLWSGGMPPALVLDAAGNLQRSLPARHMALGALPEAEFDARPEQIELRAGERLLCCTDGVVEAANYAGELFGEQRLAAAPATAPALPMTEAVLAALRRFAGDRPLGDDVTVFALDSANYRGTGAADAGVLAAWEGFRWRNAVTFAAPQLRTGDSLDRMLDSLPAHQLVPAVRADLSAIINELFVNAVDHGVLALGSQLKERDDGMAAYFAERERRLRALQTGRVHIALECRVEAGELLFDIRCEDSGPGFDLSAALAAAGDDGSRSGRGLRLLAALSETLEGDGRGLSLRYRWPRRGA